MLETMTEDERKALIKEKQAEINRLKDELKYLKLPALSSLVDEDPIEYMNSRFYGNSIQEKRSLNDTYKEFVAIARRLCAKPGEPRPKLKDISLDDTKLLADFPNEIIPVYNSYWRKIHD